MINQGAVAPDDHQRGKRDRWYKGTGGDRGPHLWRHILFLYTLYSRKQPSVFIKEHLFIYLHEQPISTSSAPPVALAAITRTECFQNNTGNWIENRS